MAFWAFLPINAAFERRFFRANFRIDAAFEDEAFIGGRCLLEGCIYKKVAFKRGNMVKPRLYVQFFPRDGNAISRNYHWLPARGKHCSCSMSCAGNATSSEKLPKYCKLLIFWQFIRQQVLPSHRLAGLQFSRAMAAQYFLKTALRSLAKNCSCSLSLIDYLR